jgi:hypothetical protein
MFKVFSGVLFILLFDANYFFFIILSEVRLSQLGTATTTGLLYQPRMIDGDCGAWRLAGETEVLGENVLQRHFVHYKSHMTRSGLEPEQPQWEASD